LVCCHAGDIKPVELELELARRESGRWIWPAGHAFLVYFFNWCSIRKLREAVSVGVQILNYFIFKPCTHWKLKLFFACRYNAASCMLVQMAAILLV
jgi:hypothetical protein